MTDRAATSGRNYGWKNQRFVISQERYFGVGQTSWGYERPVADVMGQPGRAIGYVEGQVKLKPMSIEMLRRSADVLRADLAAKDKAAGGVGNPLDATFDVVLSQVATGLPTITDNFNGCKLMNEEFSTQPGADPNKVKVEIYVSEMKLNGVLIGGEIE